MRTLLLAAATISLASLSVAVAGSHAGQNQAAQKANAPRYGTFGFEPLSNLDDGTVWPTAYAVTDLTKKDLEFLAERLRRAIS